MLEEIPRVREDLGYPPLVTPMSQMVGVQATQNVLLGERYKSIGKEVKAYLHGEYGRAPGKVNSELVKKALGDEKPIECRFADTLKPSFEKPKGAFRHGEKRRGRFELHRFPSGSGKILRGKAQKGRKRRVLHHRSGDGIRRTENAESFIFLRHYLRRSGALLRHRLCAHNCRTCRHGAFNRSAQLSYKESAQKQPAGKAQEDSTPAPGSCGSVKLFDVPDKEAAMIMAIVADELETPLNELKFVSIKEKRRTRTEMKYNVKLNGKIYEVEVEKGVASLLKEYDAISAPAPALPAQAQPAAPAPADAVTATVTKGANAVESPLPGVVMELKVSVGAKVKRGDVVLTIEAMKMENEISASKDGTVTAFYVQKGSKVEQGTPIYELA